MWPDTTSFIAFYNEKPMGRISLDGLQALVANFTEQGFLMTNGFAYPFDKPKNIIHKQTDIEAALKTVHHLKVPSAKGLKFWNYPYEFDFSFLVDKNNGTRWMISVEDKTLEGPEGDWSEQNTQRFIETVRLSLINFPPFYGCTIFSEYVPYPLEVFGLKIEDIFEINYFGPAYIEKIGVEKLLSAPAWKSEKVSGGVLIIPSLKAIYDYDSDTIDAVKKYLNLV